MTELAQRDGSVPFHVAVIGAGASGTLVAGQFKRLSPEGRLALIGDAPRPARGVAYDTPYQANLLNVPAGNMSAFPDDADHFLKWLKRHRADAHAGTFAPRRLYGDYLADIFDEALGGSRTIEYFHDTAVGLRRCRDLWSIRLQSGSSIQAKSVVLAFGNLQTPGDPIDFEGVASGYWRNPWRHDVATGLNPDAPVLLIGTGLTMADVALSLREVGHRGPLHALSRHGRLYQAHQPYQGWVLPIPPGVVDSPVGAFRWVRNEIEAAGHAGSDWRAVIDGLRPHTARIWQSWNSVQRRSFLRHARNLWDTHRHRMAPEVATELAALVELGVLTIHRGHLVVARQEGLDAVVTWKAASGEVHSLRVARIVNCTGPSRDYSYSGSPLIAQLRTDGLLVPDALRLGFETDADGGFVDADGEPVQGLFTLGPIRIPALWESVAMPEIRNQALALVEKLASGVTARPDAPARVEPRPGFPSPVDLRPVTGTAAESSATSPLRSSPAGRA